MPERSDTSDTMNEYIKDLAKINLSKFLQPPPTKKLLLEVETENRDPGENDAKSDQHHNYPSKVQSPLSDVDLFRQVNLPGSLNATGNANITINFNVNKYILSFCSAENPFWI